MDDSKLHLLVARLWTGFTVQVTGNAKTVEALENLLLPNYNVQSISIYEMREAAPRYDNNTVSHLVRTTNYQRLQELRTQARLDDVRP